MTDPRGIVSQTYFDALGRTTKTTADYTDGTPTASSNQTTEYTYDGDNNVLTLKADLPGSTFQQTQYVYGATTARGDGINSNDVLIATKYPDPSTGAASSGQQETYKTDALGDRLTMTDRNGSTHTYSYDVLGRQTSDAVTTLGSGVDGAVRRIDTAYDAQGNAYLFTSYADTAGTTVVNQVEDMFNGLGQLADQYQATSGSVNTSTTPDVQYGYDTLANGSRMASMTYPDGRGLNYNYGTSGSLNDTISRLDNISDSSATLESYKYLGLSTVVERDHPEDGVNLTYIGIGTGDGGDKYVGLDRFGRVVDQKWVNGSGTAVDDTTYTYDRDGNVLTQGNTLNTSLSDTYTYDNLNRLTDDTRGGSDHQSWSLDALGNSSSFTTDGTSQSRSTNDQNQLTSMDGSTLTYDANGNETTDDTGKTLVYDAWNRFVEAKSGSTSLIRYQYDALGHRDKEGSTSIYFSIGWQEIEDRDASDYTIAQYVYSPVYIDAMIERDRDTDSITDERLYVMQDANYNVTAIADTSGSVVERFQYDAYGARTVLSSSWGSTTDTYSFMQGHQGGKIDAVTKYVDFRNRELNTSQMRWMNEDPMMFVDGLNAFTNSATNPISNLDPAGLQILIPKDKNGVRNNNLGDQIRQALQDIIGDAATITYDPETGQIGYRDENPKPNTCDKCWKALKAALNAQKQIGIVQKNASDPSPGDYSGAPKDQDPQRYWGVVVDTGHGSDEHRKVEEVDPVTGSHTFGNITPFPIVVWHEAIGHGAPGVPTNKDRSDPKSVIDVENMARKCMRDNGKWPGMQNRAYEK